MTSFWSDRDNFIFAAHESTKSNFYHPFDQTCLPNVTGTLGMVHIKQSIQGDLACTFDVDGCKGWDTLTHHINNCKGRIDLHYFKAGWAHEHGLSHKSASNRIKKLRQLVHIDVLQKSFSHFDATFRDPAMLSILDMYKKSPEDALNQIRDQSIIYRGLSEHHISPCFAGKEAAVRKIYGDYAVDESIMTTSLLPSLDEDAERMADYSLLLSRKENHHKEEQLCCSIILPGEQDRTWISFQRLIFPVGDEYVLSYPLLTNHSNPSSPFFCDD